MHILTRSSHLNALGVTLAVYAVFGTAAAFADGRVTTPKPHIASSILLGLAILSLAAVPRLVRPRRRASRDVALIALFHLYVNVYTLANGAEYAAGSQNNGKMTPRAVRRRYDEWRALAAQLRANLGYEAWFLARSLAKVAGHDSTDYASKRFATEARVLLWCADDPERRIARAVQVFAHIAQHLSSHRPPYERPIRLHLYWLTPSTYDSLPELSDPTWRGRIVRTLQVLRETPAVLIALMSASIGVIVALLRA